MSYRTDLFHRGPVPDRVECLRPRSVTNDIVFCKIVRIGEFQCLGNLVHEQLIAPVIINEIFAK